MDSTDEWIEEQEGFALNIACNGAFHGLEIIQTQQNLTIIVAWTFAVWKGRLHGKISPSLKLLFMKLPTYQIAFYEVTQMAVKFSWRRK